MNLPGVLMNWQRKLGVFAAERIQLESELQTVEWVQLCCPTVRGELEAVGSNVRWLIQAWHPMVLGESESLGVLLYSS